MKKTSMEKPNYGNWVSLRIIFVPLALSLILLGLAILYPILLALAAPCLLIALYFMVARYLFFPHGGNVQDRIRGLVLSNLDWNGEGQVLDIGCGNGALAIELAKRHKEAHVMGIDYWGEHWKYSKKVCEKNAELEGVAERVRFLKASATALPFEDNSFDVVVSNLVFHEVRGVKDKKDLIREAMRAVKKGGLFVFQDLFLWKSIYGKPDELMSAVRSWGVKKAEIIDTSKSAFIPAVLKLPFMIGKIALIIGQK